MKKLMSLLVALGLLAGTGAVFAQPPAQTDQPKAEKKGQKTKTGKRKAEEPKAQKKKK